MSSISFSCVRTPLLIVFQTLSDEVSKALLSQSASCQSAYPSRVRWSVQLHAESGAEDGEQHGRVAAEDRAASAVRRDRWDGCARRNLLVDIGEYLWRTVSLLQGYTRKPIDLRQPFLR